MSSDSSNSIDPSQWKVEEVLSIIIVCVIFLTLSDCFGIFRRFFCGFCYRRNQVQRRLLDESIPEDPSMQLQSRGLEFSVVHSLPTFQFKKSEGEQEDKGISVECAICLGEFEEGEWLKHLPHCSHSFHVSCIDTWFQSHSNCPLCRSFVHHHMILQCSHTSLQPLRREDSVPERVQPIISENMPIRQQPSAPAWFHTPTTVLSWNVRFFLLLVLIFLLQVYWLCIL